MADLHDLAARAVRKAQALGATICPLADFGAIAELDRLARAIDNPPGSPDNVYLDMPITVGGVALYRLSWGASDWITDYAERWWADDAATLNRAIVWAHAHARDGNAIRTMAHPLSARIRIRMWSWSHTAPIADLLQACDHLDKPIADDANAAPREPNTEPLGNGGIFERLIAEYGHDIDYWMFTVSSAALLGMLRARSKRFDDEAHDSALANGEAPPTKSRKTRAVVAFQRAAKQFVEGAVKEVRRAQSADGLPAVPQ